MELKAAANAKQHQMAFIATQSLLEFAISKPGTAVIDYQIMNTTPQVYTGFALAGASALTTNVDFIGCGKGPGGSLEDNKGFSYNFYNIRGSGSNAAGTATSNQTLGVRFPSAC
jgi:hypothetical protein